MTRTYKAAFVAAFLVAGAAFGQSPVAIQAPMPSVPFSLDVPAAPVRTTASVVTTVAQDAWWGNADFLVGTLRGERLPTLVTTSPAGTDRTVAGVLGQPGTSVLFGNRDPNTQARFGVRSDMGYWFAPDKTFGIETGFLILGGAQSSFTASSDGSQILARPFTDVTTGNRASAFASFPGSSSGSITASDVAHRLSTGTLDMSANVYASSSMRIDTLLGYRYLQYEDQVQILQSVRSIAGVVAAGTTVQSMDNFRSRNQFNGMDVGVRATMWFDDLSLEVLAKISGGVMTRQGDIYGSQTVTSPGQSPVTNAGGLLALQSNLGSPSDHTDIVIPEVGVALGYQVTGNIRLRIGYTLLGVPNVVRASDRIDLGVNPNLIPPANTAAGGPSRPGATSNSDIWLQALTVGAEVRF